MNGPDQTPGSSYSEVRDKLRARGYLQDPVGRFVLGGVGRRRFAAFAVLRASAKATLIGGPLVGALLAGAAAVANRPLLGVADLLLLWAYFSAAAALGLFVLNLAAAAPLAARARRRGARPGDGLAAALVVGLPTLGYLVLLWVRRGPQGGALADVLFLALSLGLALVVAWLAGLVSLAALAGGTGEVPERMRRAMPLLALALAPVGILVLVGGGLFAPDTPRTPDEFPVAEDGRRLLFVGVDGLEAGLIEAFEPRGAVDGLLAAMGHGSVFPLRRDVGQEPARVWTDLLTGMAAGEHGVTGAGSERLPGIATPLGSRSGPLPVTAALRFLLPTRTVPTTGTQRTVRTLWEIVALRHASAAVGWWATWPAIADAGARATSFVVSDRVLAKLLAGAEGDRDTLPASLFGRLQNDFDTDRQALRAGFAVDFPAADGEFGRLIWESYLIDAYAWNLVARLGAGPETRGVFVYLPGLDILRHRLARAADGSAIETVLRIQEGIEAYLGWLDGLISPRLRDPGPDWRVILVGDPGREGGPGSEGFVLVSGADTAEGCLGPPVGPLDVAPLTLSVLGFPVSEEMRGGVPAACLAPEASRGPRVATYGRKARPPARLAESDFDAEMLERLRSLGYLN